MALWDKLKTELDRAGRAAQTAFDEGKVRLEILRVRQLADKAAQALGYAVYNARKGGGELDQESYARLSSTLAAHEAEINRLESQMAAEKAAAGEATASSTTSSAGSEGMGTTGTAGTSTAGTSTAGTSTGGTTTGAASSGPPPFSGPTPSSTHSVDPAMGDSGHTDHSGRSGSSGSSGSSGPSQPPGY